MKEEQNLLSVNLARIQSSTDSIRNVTGTTGAEIETVAQAVSDLNDDNIAKDQEIAELEEEIERITPKGTKSITNNGITDVTNYANVDVNVPGITPTGTYNISDNGIYNVTNYASAQVNVPKGITPSGTINISSNGVVDVTQYASAAVSVSGGGDSGIPQVDTYDDLYNLTAEKGDMALVYKIDKLSLLDYAQVGRTVTTLVFPATIIFPSPVERAYASVRFPEWEQVYMDCWGEDLYIEYMGQSDWDSYQYHSEDGGYTFTIEGGEARTKEINKVIEAVSSENGDVILSQIYMQNITSDGLFTLDYGRGYAIPYPVDNPKTYYFFKDSLPYPGGANFIYNIEAVGDLLNSFDYIGFDGNTTTNPDRWRLYLGNDDKLYVKLLNGNMSFYVYHYQRGEIAGSMEPLKYMSVSAPSTICLQDFCGFNLEHNWSYGTYSTSSSFGVNMSIYDEALEREIYPLVRFTSSTKNQWVPSEMGITLKSGDVLTGKTGFGKYGFITGKVGSSWDAATIKTVLNIDDGFAHVKLYNLRKGITNDSKVDADVPHGDQSPFTHTNCVYMPISNYLDLTNENYYDYIFAYNSNLKFLDISNWTFDNCRNLAGFVRDCSSLEKIKFPEGSNTYNVHSLGVELGSTFMGCSKLQEINLSYLVGGLADPRFAFKNCSSLRKVDMRNLCFTSRILGDISFWLYDMFSGVPAGCLVIVGDTATKNAIKSRFNSLDVKTKAEYEGGNS